MKSLYPKVELGRQPKQTTNVVHGNVITRGTLAQYCNCCCVVTMDMNSLVSKFGCPTFNRENYCQRFFVVYVYVCQIRVVNQKVRIEPVTLKGSTNGMLAGICLEISYRSSVIKITLPIKSLQELRPPRYVLMKRI